MIGVDTNVLARLFLDDDPKQTASARKFFAARNPADPAFISALVIAEFVWLLTSRYRYPVDSAHAALAVVFGSGDVVVEREGVLKEAIAAARAANADVADALIAAIALDDGASSIVTFDRDAAKLVPGMELLK